MRKIIQVGVGLAAAMMLLAGCTSGVSSGGTPDAGGSAGPTGPAGLIKAGELSVCIDPEYAPLEYYENGSGGEIIGADADSSRALAKEMGLKLKFQVTSFDGLIPGLVSDRCDLQLGGLYMSKERLAVVDAAPFMLAGPAILVATKFQDKVKTEMDLCGMKVAAQSASSNAIKIHALSDKCKSAGKDAITITEYPQTADTVLAVINGKSDALIETNVGAAYIASQNAGTMVVIPDIFKADTTFGAFVKKDNPLKASIVKGLKAIYDDGTLVTIMKKYNLDPHIVDVY